MKARAALRYDDGAKRLILPFKHFDRTEIRKLLLLQRTEIDPPAGRARGEINVTAVGGRRE